MTQVAKFVLRDVQRPTHEGAVLGERYRVLAPVGSAEMCDLYQGEHVRLRRPVTIQFLMDTMCRDEGALAQFRVAAETMSRLRHPNILEILEFDVTPEGTPYLVLERIRGRPLGQWLTAHPSVVPSEIVQIVGQISSALSSAHTLGVVHGALRPSKVHISDLPTGPFVQLVGFGHREELGSSDLDEGGSQRARYLAPEQAHRPEAPPTPSSDQYQLATLAFELLAGRHPFAEMRDGGALTEHIISTPSPSIRLWFPEVPAALDAAIARGLLKSPELRFSSMSEFATALLRGASSSSSSEGLDPRNVERLNAYRRRQGEVRLPPSTLSRAAGRYSTSDFELNLRRELAQARFFAGEGNWILSLAPLRRAIEMCRRVPGRLSDDALSQIETRLSKIVWSLVKKQDVRLRRNRSFPLSSSELGKEDRQLLGRVGWAMTVDEIVRSSKLEPPEAWCSLAHLVLLGALKPSAPTLRLGLER